MAQTKLEKPIPVTRPDLHKAHDRNDRYLLGRARTERGALRVLNRLSRHSRPHKRAFIVRLGHERGLRVWEPA
jgi:hypothetical protein